MAGQSPLMRVRRYHDQLQTLQRMLCSEITKLVRQSQLEVAGVVKQLKALDPEKILARGYSYVTSDGQVVKTVQQVQLNQPVMIHLADVEIEATITKVRKDQNGNN